jgi:hypothetical protein
MWVWISLTHIQRFFAVKKSDENTEWILTKIHKGLGSRRLTLSLIESRIYQDNHRRSFQEQLVRPGIAEEAGQVGQK